MRAPARIAAAFAIALLLGACGKAEVVRRDYPVGARSTSSTTARPPPRATTARPAPVRPAPAPIAIPDDASAVVRAGDTLYGISRRYGLAVADVAAWNGLGPPYTLHVGQRLRLRAASTTTAATTAPTPGVPTTLPKPPPTTTASPTPFVTVPVAPSITPSTAPPSVPVAPATSPPATTPPPTTAVVETTGATTRPPTASIPDNAPPGSPATTTTATTPAPPPVTTAPSTPVVAPPTSTAPVITGPGATPPRDPITSTKGPRWQWPTRGSLVGRFVSGDQTRQGIDIAGQAGQRVDAAADGVVVYSGAGLVGYGELVIVKHTDEWLSAYAHNRRRLVAEGTKVRAGDAIAEMGRSGAIRDMLHFEIRRNGKPVDPLQYLPLPKVE
jgi:lipoprotein NlpD